MHLHHRALALRLAASVELPVRFGGADLSVIIPCYLCVREHAEIELMHAFYDCRDSCAILRYRFVSDYSLLFV
jgi:hypothetical protein